MKNSTIEQIHKRYQWMQDVIAGTLKLTKTQQSKLTDMKKFCELEVTGLFDKISYNTLKNFCLQNFLPGAPPNTEDHWEHMLSTREKIHLIYTTTTSIDNDSDKPSYKTLINEAYNQAQLASIAYLELFKFIKIIAESDSTLSDPTKHTILNFLYESHLKFEMITSYSPQKNKTWSIIKGGKEDA